MKLFKGLGKGQKVVATPTEEGWEVKDGRGRNVNPQVEQMVKQGLKYSPGETPEDDRFIYTGPVTRTGTTVVVRQERGR